METSDKPGVIQAKPNIASFIRSGINGNLNISEGLALGIEDNRFFYKKWN